MNTLHDLLLEELRDIYDAEQQLRRALPRMARKASSPRLGEALSRHAGETEDQIVRLDEIANKLGWVLTGVKCPAMRGLIEECDRYVGMDGQGPILDAALAGSAQRVEHYEIAAYGNARALAEEIGEGDIAQQLQDALDEERGADLALTALCQDEVFPASREVSLHGRAG